MLLDLEGPGVLRRIAIRMYWDGEEEPSVSVPLGDFFGNGFEKTHYTALPMGVSSGGFYTYLPMPFASHARIVVVNGTGRTVDAFYFNADAEVGVDLDEPVATFHAWWNRDRRTTSPEPHLLLEARGWAREPRTTSAVDGTSMRMEIEHGHGNEEVADYATVGYWYQVEPHGALPPLPPPNQRRVLGVRIPAEAISGAELSRSEGEGAAVTLDVPVPRPDRYQVWVYPSGVEGGGTARFRIPATGRVAEVEVGAPAGDGALP